QNAISCFKTKECSYDKKQRQINNLKYGILIPFLFLIITNAVGRQLKGKNMKGIVPKGYVVTAVKVLPQNHYLLITEQQQKVKDYFHFQIPIILIKDSAGSVINKGQYVTSSLVPCGNEGFREVRVKGNAFTIVDDLCGDGLHIYSYVTFRYNYQLKSYVLSDYRKTLTSGGNDDSSSSVDILYIIKKGLRFGKVTADTLLSFKLSPQSEGLYKRFVRKK
ncbi:hypothetical protein HMPREF6745_0007, partial [Prevotella sp. oral taxon 472 str. F0295]